MNLDIKQHRVTCDDTNNPPSCHDGTLSVRVEVQFKDQVLGEHYVLDLPIDLEALRRGRLTNIAVRYPK